jgi:putative Holliday junction resolvase
MDEYADLCGKRIMSIDFGLRRIGFAVCDEMHITTRPIDTYINDEQIFNKIEQIISSERISAVVIGVPVRNDDKNKKLIDSIYKFAEEIENKFSIKPIYFDEFLSSKKAASTMVEIGMKKSKRAQKGSLDKIAAAIILRDFLNENNL